MILEGYQLFDLEDGKLKFNEEVYEIGVPRKRHQAIAMLWHLSDIDRNNLEESSRFALVGVQYIDDSDSEIVLVKGLLDGLVTDDDNKFFFKNGKLHREAVELGGRGEGPAVELTDGDREWWVDGKRSRASGPAVISGCTKEWWVDGKRSRAESEGPAIEFSCGGKEWYLHGLLHRTGGPAVEYKSGRKEWWFEGKASREGGPAVELANGDKIWMVNGVIHRTSGPAIENLSGESMVVCFRTGEHIYTDKSELFFLWGKEYYKEHFNEIVSFKFNRAARCIQRGCRNWLDKPVTADGKLGVNLRIGLRKDLGYTSLYPPSPQN